MVSTGICQRFDGQYWQILYGVSMSDLDKHREEEFSDATIGANVAILRGERTQKFIADEMRKRGVKWSQTTVWEIESGKRSLKAKEAKILAGVLNTTVDRLFDETATTRVRFVIERGIRKVKSAEIAASDALEKYALVRTQAFALADEALTELEESGVDHDEALWIQAQHLKRLATKSLEEALEQRAQAIAKAKETFGDGYTLRFHPGVNELVSEEGEDAYYGLIEILSEGEFDGQHPEEA